MQHNPDARLSIVAYKPKPGKEAELMALTLEHVPYLQKEGMATSRPHIIAKAGDGTIVEVFEWAEGGLERAHAHVGLSAMWQQYSAVCDYVPLTTLAETHNIFANFVPVK